MDAPKYFVVSPGEAISDNLRTLSAALNSACNEIVTVFNLLNENSTTRSAEENATTFYWVVYATLFLLSVEDRDYAPFIRKRLQDSLAHNTVFQQWYNSRDQRGGGEGDEKDESDEGGKEGGEEEGEEGGEEGSREGGEERGRGVSFMYTALRVAVALLCIARASGEGPVHVNDFMTSFFLHWVGVSPIELVYKAFTNIDNRCSFTALLGLGYNNPLQAYYEELQKDPRFERFDPREALSLLRPYPERLEFAFANLTRDDEAVSPNPLMKRDPLYRGLLSVELQGTEQRFVLELGEQVMDAPFPVERAVGRSLLDSYIAEVVESYVRYMGTPPEGTALAFRMDIDVEATSGEGAAHSYIGLARAPTGEPGEPRYRLALINQDAFAFPYFGVDHCQMTRVIFADNFLEGDEEDDYQQLKDAVYLDTNLVRARCERHFAPGSSPEAVVKEAARRLFPDMNEEARIIVSIVPTPHFSKPVTRVLDVAPASVHRFLEGIKNITDISLILAKKAKQAAAVYSAVQLDLKGDSRQLVTIEDGGITLARGPTSIHIPSASTVLFTLDGTRFMGWLSVSPESFSITYNGGRVPPIVVSDTKPLSPSQIQVVNSLEILQNKAKILEITREGIEFEKSDGTQHFLKKGVPVEGYSFKTGITSMFTVVGINGNVVVLDDGRGDGFTYDLSQGSLFHTNGFLLTLDTLKLDDKRGGFKKRYRTRKRLRSFAKLFKKKSHRRRHRLTKHKVIHKWKKVGTRRRKNHGK